jgi:eukaryotic-like serine/threonine-protein kinase
VRPIVRPTSGTPQVAEQRLNAAGFQTARNPVESTPQNFDRVVAMNPAGQAAQGTTIRLDVGAGPAGVEVPNLLGLDRVRAQATLQQVGLVLSGDQHEQVVQDDNGVGRVLIQDPPAGRRLARGKSVTITVGVRDTQLQMLDLRGQTPTQALNTMRKLGWTGTLKQLFTEVNDANQVGVIVSQDVPPGTGFAHDQTITITVGRSSTTTSTTTSGVFGTPGSTGPG